MELLYIWINKSKFGLFEKSEFNFSPNFRFGLKKNENDWFFLYCEVREKHNVFAKGSISNITAVVGKNGSGKSTLLSYLYSNMMPLKTEDTNDADYNPYIQEVIALKE